MADRLPPGQGALQNWNNINSNKPEEYSSEFTIGGNKFANVTDVSTGQRQLYFVQPLTGARGLLQTTNADGSVTPGDKLSNFNQFNPGKLAAAEAASKQASVKLLSTPGISTPTEAEAIKNSSQFKSTTAGQNSASGSGTSNPAPSGQAGTSSTPAQSADAAKEAGSTKEGTRTSYATDMIYPLSLKLESQDVIKFSILEYSPSLAAENQGGGQFGSTKSRVVTLEGNNPIIKGSKRIGVITLPIPAGITDSNPVGWEQDKLNMLQSEAANLAKSFLEGGVDAAGSAIKGSAGTVQSNSGEVKDAVTNLIIGQAVQANIASRASGAINNNNVELLFSGPSLRTFSFQFMFYPRNSNEAKMVRQIIRAFKQAMSVKRSKSSLLLKAPHTFAISYLTAGQKAHPYLNRFKECALSSCNVEYTPDGTYMTYDGPEKSMTAYRLSLTFQELEPLFDDEYGSDNNNIGF